MKKKKSNIDCVLIPGLMILLALGIATWVLYASYTATQIQQFSQEFPNLKPQAEKAVLAKLDFPDTAEFSEPVVEATGALIKIDGHVRAKTNTLKEADMLYTVAYMRQGEEWVLVHLDINGVVFIHSLQ